MENLKEQIIELVRANPCIYNKLDVKYKDVQYKEKIWQSIAMNLNLPVKECKIKWKSLRDRYRREKNSDYLPSSSSKIGAPWKYSGSLDFLADPLEGVNTLGHFWEETDDGVDDWLTDGSQSTPSKPSTKKRKHDDLFVDVLMAMKRKYEIPDISSTVKYQNFFGMLREKFDRLPESDVDDVQLEILQLVNRKINSKHNN